MRYIKGVKDPFEARGDGGISLEMPQWKTASFCTEGRGESPGYFFFFELKQETWGSSRIMPGTSETHSCCLMKVQSPCELRRVSLDTSAVGARS